MSERRAASAIRVVLGLALGMLLAEGMFTLRDRGAWPRLNVYVSDPTLGVRLQPGSQTRLAYSGNPPTTVRINSTGYRGADWPAPQPDEVLIIGDSQVFGHGVEEDETFSAQLSGLLGRTVLNAGVPTYGPGECLDVAEEILQTRQPQTVVFGINMANDLFELDAPNTARHAARYGWATRPEHAGSEHAALRWLYHDSHLFYALWWLVREKRGEVRSSGFFSREQWVAMMVAGMERARRAPESSPLAGPIARLKAICAATGCQPMVLVLPLDVQLGEAQWSRYNAEPIDLASSLLLNADVLDAAADLGIAAVDARPAIAGVPDAFLLQDIHLTPAGHRAVAEALADAIR